MEPMSWLGRIRFQEVDKERKQGKNFRRVKVVEKKNDFVKAKENKTYMIASQKQFHELNKLIY